MGALRRLCRSVVVTLTLAGGFAACDVFTSPADNVINLEVDSSDGSQVLVITSQRFTVGVTQDGLQLFNLLESDTAWVDTPYQKTFKVSGSDAGIGGFYAQAAASENPDAVVSMRVVLDGKEAYSDQTVLTGDGLRYYYRRY
jgi:hypothetical protein